MCEDPCGDLECVLAAAMVARDTRQAARKLSPRRTFRGCFRVTKIAVQSLGVRRSADEADDEGKGAGNAPLLRSAYPLESGFSLILIISACGEEVCAFFWRKEPCEADDCFVKRLDGSLCCPAQQRLEF